MSGVPQYQTVNTMRADAARLLHKVEIGSKCYAWSSRVKSNYRYDARVCCTKSKSEVNVALDHQEQKQTSDTMRVFVSQSRNPK